MVVLNPIRKQVVRLYEEMQFTGVTIDPVTMSIHTKAEAGIAPKVLPSKPDDPALRPTLVASELSDLASNRPLPSQIWQSDAA